MNIEIKIDELTVDTIIAKVFEYDEDGDIIGEQGVKLGDAIRDRLFKAVKDGDGWSDALAARIKTIRGEEIRVACRDEIQAALTAPIKQTNGFGESTGAPTTLREMIFGEAKKALGRSGSRYDSDKTLIEKVISVEIQKALLAEVKPILDQAKADIGVAVNQITADILAGVASKISGGK